MEKEKWYKTLLSLVGLGVGVFLLAIGLTFF